MQIVVVLNRDIQAAISYISPYHFEHLVGEVWEKRGWKTTVTPATNDFGIDLIAEKENPYYQKQVIQVKCYSNGNSVGGPEIREIAGLYQQEPDADTVIVVTSSQFTQNAKEVANKTNVKLIDGDALLNIIDKNKCFDSIMKYRDMSITDGESGENKSERLYSLFEKRKEKFDSQNIGPCWVEIYFTLDGRFRPYYNQIANSHEVSGLNTEMARRMTVLAEREEMSTNKSSKSDGISIHMMCANRYQKGTEDHLDYHFDIACKILDEVYGIGVGGIEWAVLTDNSNIFFTWTEV